MTGYYWNDWYMGWGWFLWFGLFFSIFASFGNLGYTYTAHRRFRALPYSKDANEILNERYAKGEINRDEFNQMKIDIQNNRSSADKIKTKSDSSPLQPQINS